MLITFTFIKRLFRNTCHHLQQYRPPLYTIHLLSLLRRRNRQHLREQIPYLFPPYHRFRLWSHRWWVFCPERYRGHVRLQQGCEKGRHYAEGNVQRQFPNLLLPSIPPSQTRQQICSSTPTTTWSQLFTYIRYNTYIIKYVCRMYTNAPEIYYYEFQIS